MGEIFVVCWAKMGQSSKKVDFGSPWRIFCQIARQDTYMAVVGPMHRLGWEGLVTHWERDLIILGLKHDQF